MTVIITGGSSGIGLAASRLFAEYGCFVFELSRHDASVPKVTHIDCDVTDDASVQTVISRIAAETARVDALIVCAGFGISGSVENTEISDAKRQFDVNYFGAVSAITAALPYLRESRGRIIIVSSVAAILPVPFQAHYSASKSALNALVLSLRGETAPHGVSVCAVLPGDTKTGFTGSRIKKTDDGVYSAVSDKSVRKMERDEQNGMDPASVARLIFRVARKKTVRPFYIAGPLYRLFGFAVKVLPARLVCYIESKMYG